VSTASAASTASTAGTAGTAQDERVAAALAHWAPRFVANGTDYPDFVATLSRITRWDDWCREWGSTAESYERLAQRAEDEGHPVTAGGAWRRAALCWHWGKYVFVDHPDEMRAAHDRTVDCYRRGAGTLTPPAERVEIPYASTSLAGYLRVPPATQGATTQAAAGPLPPVVIMVPGLDSVKEELQATADYFLARGLATLAIDGPGQGEAEYELPIEPAYEKVAAAVADFLGSRADIDPGRIGLMGVSLGGYYAARCAAYEPRLRAAVALAGPYRFDLDWDTRPPQSRATFQYRSGAGSPEEARQRAAALTLEQAAPEITIPLLVVHGQLDRMVLPQQAERLAAEAPGAELAMYPRGNHGVTNQPYESRSMMADWLAGHLNGF
jgi:dipeptidyl aminopeptidase/acylaminoacyl peptidase